MSAGFVVERPILFNASMVRAILDGSKTQTRRAFIPAWCRRLRLAAAAGEVSNFLDEGILQKNDLSYIVQFSPYGQPGDRLWVRETWQGPLFDDLEAYRAEPSAFQKPEFCKYAADGSAAPEFFTADDELVRRWRPSIHMLRWASRILLEIVSVRVERLQDIRERDAWAEGCMGSDDDVTGGISGYSEYSALWESINGPGSWEINPWVWAIEFKRVPA